MKRFIVSAYSGKFDGGLMVLQANSLEEAFEKYCKKNGEVYKQVHPPTPPAPKPVADGLDDGDVFGEEPFHIACLAGEDFTWQQLYDDTPRGVYYLCGEELREEVNLSDTVQW